MWSPPPPPPTTPRSFKVVRRDLGPHGWAAVPRQGADVGTGHLAGGGHGEKHWGWQGWRRFWKEEAQDCLGADQGPEEGGSV